MGISPIGKDAAPPHRIRDDLAQERGAATLGLGR
jgi:hypothetical protein